MADKNLKIIIDAVDNASKTLNGIGNSIGKTQANFKELSQKAGIAMAGVGGAITGLGGLVVREAAKFEQYETSFNTLLGSVEEGTKFFDELKEFSAVTPFNIENLAEAGKRLLAFGTESKDVVPTLRALGDISSVVGTEKLPQLITAFGQIQAKGRLMGGELLQLTETGVPIIEELARVTGYSAEEITNNTADLGITFDQVREAMFNMSEEGGLAFNAMAMQSQTTAGKFSNFQDDSAQLSASIGNALLPIVNKLLETIIPLAEKFQAFIENNTTLVTGFFALGATLAVLGTTILVLTPVITALSMAFSALGLVIAFLTSPIGLVILAIGALVTAGIWLMTHWEQVKAFAISTWNAIKMSIQTIIEGIKTVITNTMNSIKTVIQTVLDSIKQAFSSKLEESKGFISSFAEGAVGLFNKVKGAIDGLISRLSDLKNKAGEALGSVKGKLGFKHGGTIPGGFNDAVPTILHGGERVVSHTGSDVNQGGGGGGVNINLTIEGDVNSMDMVERITQAVKDSIGRDDELSRYGVGF